MYAAQYQVPRCTLFMVLYLGRMCRYVLHAVLTTAVLTRGAHRYTYAPPCRMYRRTFIHLSVSLWNNLGDLVFDGVGLPGLKNRANAGLLALLLALFLCNTDFPFSSFNIWVGIVGFGSSD